MAKRPQDLVAQPILDENYDPFLYDYDEDEMDIDYDNGESHYPSEYDEWYKDKEDVYDAFSIHPTKKKGIVYVMSDFMGDGFTRPENIANYFKAVTPYNKREWEKENGGR